MKCKVLLSLLFLVSLAQGQSSYFRFVAGSVSSSSAINLQNSGSIYHQISFTKTGIVLSCTVAVDSSADGISWSAGAIITGQTCTSNGDSLPQTHVVANYMRVNVTAFTGSGTVTVVYTGYTTTTGGGSGTVTSFSAGNLSPLFTTSVATATTTPALSFSLSNAAGGTVFGNNTTASAGPAFTAAPVIGIPGTSTGTIALASSTASGKYTITAPANAATPTITLPTGSGTVAVSATSPTTLSATTGDIGCATCTTNASALTSNSVMLGAGSQASKVDTALVTDGAGAITDTTVGTVLTATQGTITTSHPLVAHTATWNAAGVAFTNWLSNITCTAAATASIAAGFGTAGTQWQFKYGAANCASPQLLSPDGATAAPAYGFSSGTTTGMYKIGSVLEFPIAGADHFAILANAVGLRSSGVYSFSSTTTPGGSLDTGVSRSGAAILAFGTQTSGNTTGKLKAAAYMSVGTKFTTDNGCTDSATAGGATAGTFTVGSTSCTEVITMGDSATAPNGWSCTVVDITTLADVTNPHQTTSSTTTATIVTGTVVSGDKIQFSCIGY